MENIDGIELLNKKKKIITNSSLIALYLIIASHFTAPPLLDLFAFSIRDFKLSIFLPLTFILPAITETNPWILILDLFPHFFFGFEVETALGSKVYACSLFYSGVVTNSLTYLTIFILNQFFNFMNPDFYFASSAPIVLFSITTFCIFFNSSFGPISNLGSTSLLVYYLIYILGFLTGMIQHWIHLINFIYALIVNFFIIHWIDNSISLKKYFETISLQVHKNPYSTVPDDPASKNATQKPTDLGVDLEPISGKQLSLPKPEKV
ncbi:hypothetical protein TRFO_16435 [Tritrichomonas foetus]|uniref:Uncharacterized protein n=1 Tax=Tritrichomonas foetus TaxID=1144522 RepID=A0A1J4KUM1_9EUKA|nr:hypothetical protein TRFO_16435 [Tritrichomonas foetus]|eukprot:OHT13358.1 hypothetical protein TRFO_16435 [Tritrichomonas foetus]